MGLGWEREGGERVICAQRRNRRPPDDTLQARGSLEMTFLRSVLQLRIVYFRGFSIDHLFKCDCTSFMKTLHCDCFYQLLLYRFRQQFKTKLFHYPARVLQCSGTGKRFSEENRLSHSNGHNSKTKRDIVPRWFSDMWVPELLLPPPQKRFLAQNMHFWSF